MMTKFSGFIFTKKKAVPTTLSTNKPNSYPTPPSTTHVASTQPATPEFGDFAGSKPQAPSAEDASPTPAERHRTFLQPTRRQAINRKSNATSAPRSVPVSVEHETPSADDPLPEAYSGTVDGKRYYTPESYTADHVCGDLKEHKLRRGHWIRS